MVCTAMHTTANTPGAPMYYVSPAEINNLTRQICLDKPLECVAISAIHRETLRPLVERVAAAIGKFAVSKASQH